VRFRMGLVCIVFSALQIFASTPLTPTTTLSAEAGNNTSAAPTFVAQSNGNATPGNVSKVATGTLLYGGSNTSIYAHFMPWFGVSYHMNVGYNSADPAQVKKQVDDMISRGIAGVIIDWYGPNAAQENATSLAMAKEATSRNGAFQFAIMEDAGAISSCANQSGCDVTAALISDLNYISSTYISSPAYIRWNGNPVVFYFGVESYPIDWTRVRANVASNLQFVFENDGGFTRSYSSGGFSWVQPSSVTQSDPMSLNYLNDFYSTAQQYPAKLPVGASYKGFNDSLASWGSNRIMQQQCGQTWLSSFGKANSMWSAAKQLAFFQLVTWNDYEEATEIETGIDNCVSISASVSAAVLSWSIAGNENTIDHYTVFISSDGQNLMSLGDFVPGTRQLDLSSFGFASGTYSVYVKAVGRPSILNHISAAATYNSSGGTQPQPPVARLSVSPGSGAAPLAVTASTSASTDPQGGALSSTINFGDGSTAAGPTASHTYANAGNYTVSATVTDAMNLQSQATATVTATTQPTLTVAQPANNSAVPGPIHVVASGSAPSGVDALQIYLDHNLVFQINASSFDTTVAAGPGPHLVVVKLWDKVGNAYMQSLNVTVAAPFTASLTLTPTSAAPGATVAATVSSNSGTIASSQIAWGDGTSSTGPSAAHAYSQAGNYMVTASATSTLGASSQATAAVSVQAATATLGISQPANGATAYSPVHVVAAGSASAGVDAMQIYLDGALVYQVNAGSLDTTVPASVGTHAVVVKLWDKAGNAYMKSVSVKVIAPLATALSLNTSTVSVGGSVQATLTATSGTIGSSFIYWGDGTHSSGPVASHSYAAAGTYTVTSVAADAVKSTKGAPVTVIVTAQ
jgi:PKD repeat protein